MGTILYFFWDGFSTYAAPTVSPQDVWSQTQRADRWSLTQRPNTWVVTER